jgi:RimJ/RimL family protein N-acetyltransferase
MCDWQASQGIARLSAQIQHDHTASNAVAAKLGLDPTGKLDDEGEMIWK